MINIKELKKYCDTSYITVRNDKIIINNRRLSKLSRTKINEIEKEFNIPVIISKKYEEISQKIGRYISKYNIIQPQDHIIVGLSGGKDSLILLHLLESYRRKYGIKLYAVTVDLNIDGVRPWSENNKNINKLKNHCKNLNIPHKIIPFNNNVVEMSEILTNQSKGMEYSPCFSCSIGRRKILTDFSKELSISENIPMDKIKICFGHTLEDNSDTVLANLLKGGIIKVLSPIKKFGKASFNYGEYSINLKQSIIIRPLLSISEKDIKIALEQCNIKYYKDKEQCPYSRERGDGIRRKSHNILCEVEGEVKNIREMVVSSAIATKEYYSKNKDN